MFATPEEFAFFEIDKPARVVRLARTGIVEELTPKGWRRAPWLSSRVRSTGTPEREDRLERRCRQRLNGTPLRQSAKRASWVKPWLRRLVEWVNPPLAYGAPVRFTREARVGAERAYDEEMPTDMGAELEADLVRQAWDGYDRQETRVAAIEHRAGAF